jgi:inosose dehydratase
MKNTFSRSSFIKSIGLGAIGLNTPNIFVNTPIKLSNNLKIGLASYTLREYNLDETIKFTKKLNINHIVLKSMHLPLDSKPEFIKEACKKVRDAGLNLYGVGVIYMKTEAEVNQAFEYAQNAGVQMIVGVPNHELLGLAEKKVKETGIKLAIHNHGPGDKVYPTPDTVFERIKNLDKNIGLCIDIGHVIRLGLDPVKNLLKYGDRLFDLHLKDIDKVEENGVSVEIGRGIIEIPDVLKALQKIKYQGIMSIEYEKDGKNAVIGLSESVGYVRGILKMLQKN